MIVIKASAVGSTPLLYSPVTRVKILRKLPPFKSGGVVTERVEIEVIDGYSPSYGRVINMNLDALERQGGLFNA